MVSILRGAAQLSCCSKLIIKAAVYVDATQPGLSPTKRAREIVAVMAEHGEHVKGELWQRAVQAIRQWLRGLGFTIHFSERDIQDMLRKAEKNVSTPSEAKRQYDAVRAKYIGTAAWMKAPNGQDTKLTEHQWVQTRTPLFKEWWGYDWETEATNATTGPVGRSGQAAGEGNTGRKDAGIVRGGEGLAGNSEVHPGAAGRLPFVHAETGEPYAFFHGTSDEFSEFDITHPNKKDLGWLGRGHYVTSDRWIAETYSRLKRGSGDPRVMELFVRPFNAAELSLKDKARISTMSAASVETISARIRAKGYDGTFMLFDGGTVELSVFAANALKSATDNSGDFSSETDNIHYSLSGARANAARVTREAADAVKRSQTVETMGNAARAVIGNKKVVATAKMAETAGKWQSGGEPGSLFQ